MPGHDRASLPSGTSDRYIINMVLKRKRDKFFRKEK